MRYIVETRKGGSSREVFDNLNDAIMNYKNNLHNNVIITDVTDIKVDDREYLYHKNKTVTAIYWTNGSHFKKLRFDTEDYTEADIINRLKIDENAVYEYEPLAF